MEVNFSKQWLLPGGRSRSSFWHAAKIWDVFLLSSPMPICSLAAKSWEERKRKVWTFVLKWAINQSRLLAAPKKPSNDSDFFKKKSQNIGTDTNFLAGEQGLRHKIKSFGSLTIPRRLSILSNEMIKEMVIRSDLTGSDLQSPSQNPSLGSPTCFKLCLLIMMINRTFWWWSPSNGTKAGHKLNLRHEKCLKINWNCRIKAANGDDDDKYDDYDDNDDDCDNCVGKVNLTWECDHTGKQMQKASKEL